MHKMEDQKLTYQAAMAEMEKLLSEMEKPDIDVEVLTDHVKRVSTLIAFCKEKLLKSESEIEKILGSAEK